MPIFADTPADRALERMMTAIPDIVAKGHGVYFGRKELTAKACDCRFCLYYRENENGCQLKRCPCIEERIHAGVASRKEVLAELASKIKVLAFQKRIIQHMKENCQ